VPSKWEARRIGYLVKAIRKGWIKLDEDKVCCSSSKTRVATGFALADHLTHPNIHQKREKEEQEAKRWYLLWDEQKEDSGTTQTHPSFFFSFYHFSSNRLFLPSSEDVKKRDQLLSAPPPKVKLPGHSESYRPPAEYLLTIEEQK